MLALSATALVGAGMGFDGSPRTVTAAKTSASDGGFDVTGYDITMDYRPDTQALRGVTVVSAKATSALDDFTLHLNKLTVHSVTVDSSSVKSFSRTGEKDLVIVPPTTIRRGAEFRVRVEYDGTPGPGWLPTESGGATAFMGNPSTWFPVHEDAHDQAAFHLTAKVPDGWSAVSVGRGGPLRPGSTTFRWTVPHVDPANVAVSVDRFSIERSALADGTPVVNAYAPGLKKTTKPLADRLPEIIEFLSGKFGRYPFRAAGNVFLHVNDDGPATAPQTRPVYMGAGNTRFMTLDAVVHEQAHQWYGISATARGPEDTCLSECFATYATWLWDEAKNGADLDARYREQVNANMGDADFWKELYRPGQAPGINMYDKGPLALHALRRQVGDKAFQRLIEQWPQAHRGGYVDWPQFERFAEKTARQDLTGFFNAWFRNATIPPDEYLWPGPLNP
ncbi:M1 family metallopeptidase [Actinomadura darangshiensis]|uniref:M1 family metallopeptidase n=1 Tax=Actinomadura darangshiensis TaxID=705336 RepID=UPI00140D3B6C|nr:M1 family metallopeptidase [Actinomadura darangshiensis]